jgi:UDP-N-acetylmuramoyl-L-alanyl-D-glutamate--2,6-diaminopimelate ligase
LVAGLTEDSRAVRPGDLFAAIKGQGHDGRDFIGNALAAGAVAAFLEGSARSADLACPRIVFKGPGFRAAVSRAGREIFGQPDQKLALVGLTGTNGKSTVSYLLEAILLAQGRKTGVVGTVNYRWPGEIRPAPNTTPEGPLLGRTLADMVAASCQVAVMEVSSHALALGRVAGYRFSQALFTNLTQDHLDFHGDLENYFLAKRKLFFEGLIDDGALRAVVGQDDPYGERLLKELGPQKALGFGFGPKAQVRAVAARYGLWGQILAVRSPWSEFELHSPLIGAFNSQNLLAAVALAGLLGVSGPVAQKALAAAPGAPGRLEKVKSPKGTLVLVDYAHTPGALETALAALRALTKGRLMVVFGCGGDRDRSKRPKMGEVVGRLADLAVLTSDNPRTEDPLAIIKEVEIGLARFAGSLPQGPLAAQAAKGYLVEPDRRRAIGLAVEILRPGDALLIAGKGHEDYQIVNREKTPFDDRLVAAEALAAAKGSHSGEGHGHRA